MTTARTYAVEYRTSTCLLSGDVTACSRQQAIDTAKGAWGAGGDGIWSAQQKPELEQAELKARHADMDEMLEACRV